MLTGLEISRTWRSRVHNGNKVREVSREGADPCARRFAYTEAMKPFVAALVLCPLLAFSAWSQTRIPFPVQPLLEVQQFLGLRDDQVKAILQNTNDYNTFS